MANNIIKVALVLACIIVGYLCYDTVADTMRYRAQVKTVEADIIKRMTEIKEAQFAYREAYGEFAKSFDSLIYGVKHGKIPEVKQVGELVDSTSKVETDTLYVPILEALKDKIKSPLDSLRYVPHSNKVQFSMNAGTITKNQVPLKVFEVEDPKPLNKERALRLGSMSDAIYTGNWEKQE
ncbi:MAG TPA: hypothetical protein VEC12_06990 [Bacteroidia bacterium]|nr:hypothetical protein [Bacteroidia bacterium]